MKRDFSFQLLALVLTGLLVLPAAGLADEELGDEEIAEELVEPAIEDELPEEEALQDLEPLPEPDADAAEQAPEADPVDPEELEPDPMPEEDPVPAGEAAVEAEPDTPEVASPERTLQLLVHPVFPPFQAEQVFQPLVDYLNDETAYQIELETTRDFHKYWLDARRGELPHLILEDAHMAAWRMDKYDYLPIVRAANPETFSLLTSAEFADDELEQFVARRVSTLPAPSLGYVILANWFENPMQQPRTLSNAQSWMDAVEIIFGFEADAAMVPNNLVERYPNLYPVEESEEFPGLTLSASPAVNSDVAEEITRALLEIGDHPEHYSALFELDIEQFETADPEEYEGLEAMLNVLFAL